MQSTEVGHIVLTLTLGVQCEKGKESVTPLEAVLLLSIKVFTGPPS